MGNSLSGFLAEIFMSFFEIELKDHPLFPRIWYRYVDDVFAICSCRKIDATLDQCRVDHALQTEVGHYILFLHLVFFYKLIYVFINLNVLAIQTLK